MSPGILYTATRHSVVARELEIREILKREVSSETPTLADLVLPGTGQAFTGEFASFLTVLAGSGE
jgi:hypothetical protein